MGVYIFISVLIIIACVIQVLVVLVQNSKGGGLAANFNTTGQSMGVRKTADFLEKSTWVLAAAVLFLCIIVTAAIPRDAEVEQSRIQDSIENAIDPNAIPTLPSTPAASSPVESDVE